MGSQHSPSYPAQYAGFYNKGGDEICQLTQGIYVLQVNFGRMKKLKR